MCPASEDERERVCASEAVGPATGKTRNVIHEMQTVGTPIVVSRRVLVSGLPNRCAVAVSLAMASYAALLIAPPVAQAQFHGPSGLGGTADPSSNDAPAVESAVVAERKFSLPVQIDASGARPAEVQLFVAESPTESPSAIAGPASQGLRWKLLNRQAFPTESFEVNSQRDGRFFFAIRTVDAGGRVTPAGDLRADVEVVIDTSGPAIELEAAATEAGQVRATIRITDATPIRQVLVQYLTDRKNQWKAVPADKIDAEGRLRFDPAEDWRMKTFRVSAMDSAGHATHLNRMVERPRLAQLPDNRCVDDGANVESQSSGTSGVWPPGPSPPVHTVAGPLARRMHAVPAGTAAAQGLLQSVAPELLPAPPGELSRSSDLPPPAAPEEIGRPLGRRETELNQPQRNQFLDDDSAPMTSPTTVDAAADEADGSETRRDWRSGEVGDSPWDPAEVMNTPRSVQEATRPLTRRPVATPYEAGRADVADAPEDPSDPRLFEAFDPGRSKAPVRYSDSPRFSLDYELEAVGSNGVDVVELWGSIDDGRSWKKWGEDPDRQSPFDIETKGEGVFGFRIVVIGANGLSTPAPRSGESADINVIVDTTKPATRISGARYGDGDATGCLVIRYECEDRFLPSRPVTLSFGAAADGPWTTIAAGLRNR